MSPPHTRTPVTRARRPIFAGVRPARPNRSRVADTVRRVRSPYEKPDRPRRWSSGGPHRRTLYHYYYRTRVRHVPSFTHVMPIHVILYGRLGVHVTRARFGFRSLRNRPADRFIVFRRRLFLYSTVYNGRLGHVEHADRQRTRVCRNDFCIFARTVRRVFKTARANTSSRSTTSTVVR